MSSRLSLLLGASLFALSSLLPAADLERIQYNNPGLIVDLGVGLWAWPVPCDADGDGDLDLVVVCPDKPYNGTWLFENASGSTAKNKFPIFKPARRLGKATTNAMPSYVDGKLRVLTPNQEYPDFLKTGLDAPVKIPMNLKSIHQLVQDPPRGKGKTRNNQWRYLDYDGDGLIDLIVGVDDWSDYGWDNAYNEKGEWQNGPLHGLVRVVRNIGSNEAPNYEPSFALEAGGKRIDTFGSPTPNFADFDGDGDLDLICGEFLDGFTYFENTGTRKEPKFAAGIRVMTAADKPLVMDLEMIIPIAIDWDLDGDTDLVVGDEDGRVVLIENTGKLRADHSPQFLPPHYFQQEAEDVKFGALVTPVGFDWDGDGDIDLIAGNTAGYIGFIENLSGPKVASPKLGAPKYLEADGKIIRIMAGANGSIQGPAEAKWGYTTLSVADWDGDALPDLIVNSILGKVHWYRNIGTGKEPKLAAAQPIEVEWDKAQPTLAYGWLRPEGKALLTQWRTTPVAVDWNKDGLTDLVMLDQEGYLAFFERVKRDGKLVLLSPKRVFLGDKLTPEDPPTKFVQAKAGEPLRMNNAIAGGSGRRKLSVVDWDGDGQLDFLINAANAACLKQTRQENGHWFFKDLGLLSEKSIEGHDVSPATVDWDGDGIPDFIGGAEDGHFYFLKNPRSH
ncbi:VCBS repeat-containing protein [soil metagenome]